MNKLKILFVDDSPNDVEIVAREISKHYIGFCHQVVNNAEDFTKTLTEFRPDIIISDHSMSDFDGLNALKITRTNYKNKPFIILTGVMDEELLISYLEAGADDCLIKKNFRLLPFAIKKVLANRKTRKKLEKQAKTIDELQRQHDTDRNATKDLQSTDDVSMKTKEALLAYEIKFSDLIESSNDGICLHDLQGKILFVNQRKVEMLGYKSTTQLIGTNAYDLLRKSEQQKFSELFKELLKKGFLANIETKVIRNDGSLLPVECNFKLIMNDKGKPHFIMDTMRDITERKLAEAELKSHLSLLQIAGETARFGGWSVDLQNNIYTWSDAVADIHEMPHGFAPKVEEGINFYAPEWREKITDVFSACAEKGIPYDEVMEIITKTGKRLWVRATGRAVKNEKGEIKRVEGSFQDINESKQADDALRETEERFQKMLSLVPDMISIHDTDMNIVYSNWNGFGAVQEDKRVLNTKCYETYRGFDDICPDCQARTVLQTKQAYQKELEMPDGSWKDLRVIPIINQDGSVELFVEWVRDITERKKSMAALQQIEWMLSEKKTKDDDFTPEYGDLSELNKNGLILSSVGKDQLTQIASEYLDLLETSSAIYEINGDYALGLFSSGWCRMMDTASRKLCETDDNQQALNCGKWLCHESCWRDASLQAIESGKPADVECNGGIRLYAVPIRAGGQVIGAINFGYTDPPESDVELQKLSELYQIPIEKLRKEGQEYQTRPQYIIDYAKKRIQFSAQYIANIVERKQAETELRRMKDDLEIQVAEKTRELQERIEELERYHDATVNREFRIKELKDEIARLKEEKDER